MKERFTGSRARVVATGIAVATVGAACTPAQRAAIEAAFPCPPGETVPVAGTIPEGEEGQTGQGQTAVANRFLAFEVPAQLTNGETIVVCFPNPNAELVVARPTPTPEATENPTVTLKNIMQGIMDQERDEIKDVKTGPLRNQAMQYLTDHPDILSKFKSPWDSSQISEDSLNDLLNFMVNGKPGAPSKDISRANIIGTLSTLFAAVSIEASRQEKTEESELAFKIADKFYDWGVSNIKLTGTRDQLATDINIYITFYSQPLRSVS